MKRGKASGQPDAVSLRPPTAPLPEDSGSRSALRYALAGLFLLLVLGVLVVFFLPGWVSERAAPVPSVSTPGEVKGPTPAEQRQQAEQSLQTFLHLQAVMQRANAPVWAPAEWQAAEERVTRADRLFGERRFADAGQAYREAIGQLEALRDSRDSRLAMALQAGDQALEQNRAEEALAHYATVLSIEAGHAGGLQGKARAEVRGQVLQAMQYGALAAESGQLDSAAEHLQTAVALDGDYEPARLALADVQSQVLERDFQAAMNEALAAVEAGHYRQAREALKRADDLRTGHPAVADARLRLQRMERETTLQRLRARASDAARSEQWAEAVSLYEQALRVDTDAAFARTGLAVAQQKAELHASFDAFLGAPERLYSEAPLRRAEQLLASTGPMAEEQPVLTDKIRLLKDKVKVAKQPLTVELRSDGETEVTVYHVGRLGRFTEHRLSLRPGRYTVTGVRRGYRDVRRVIDLQPGAAGTRLTIQCEEPL